MRASRLLIAVLALALLGLVPLAASATARPLCGRPRGRGRERS